MSFTLGLLAHVDAGKTTLAEGILFRAGSLRKQGRVDHGDTFLDNNLLERERGITIFSKQARTAFNGRSFTLLDTPGHIDFCAEMERALDVLDGAVLIISATDGVTGHTRTLLRLLKERSIPFFIFVNKTDLPGVDRQRVLSELSKACEGGVVDFTDTSGEEFIDGISMCDEDICEKALEGLKVTEEEIRTLVMSRKTFPCLFGSALKGEGVEALMDAVCRYTAEPSYGDEFAAKVFRITRDENGSKLVHMKLYGGSLKVRESIETAEGASEKVSRIRMFSGAKAEAVDEACAGDICAVSGLNACKVGDVFGGLAVSGKHFDDPVLRYRVVPDASCNIGEFAGFMQQLSEEMPELRCTFDEEKKDIYIGVMGEVQLEILSRIIPERFGVSVTFDEGSVVYKETVNSVTEGIGHFEPLRHYAEVHLLISPLPAGSGVVAETVVSEDDLDRDKQRLVLTHILEKKHRGVLTGSELTDVKITLAAGRAHIKHTEGGDFRQATYRAIRQGLMKAESVLLEPFYSFSVDVSSANVGRILTDVRNMAGTAEIGDSDGRLTTVTGTAPVISMRNYRKTLMSMSAENLILEPAGFRPCHNSDEVMEASGYDPDRDLANPASSVFCSHGGGLLVEWNEVENYMHLESVLKKKKTPEVQAAVPARRAESRASFYDDKELMDIFKRTYGEEKKREYSEKRYVGDTARTHVNVTFREPKETYLLVDGYNIIFSWEELTELSKTDIGAARHKLMDIMCNYQGYRKMNLILVFDAYKVEGGTGECFTYNNITVIYTKEAETADSYIEKASKELSKDYRVMVATSDGLEQLIIFGEGAERMSARELKEEVQRTEREIKEKCDAIVTDKNRLGDYLPDNGTR